MTHLSIPIVRHGKFDPEDTIGIMYAEKGQLIVEMFGNYELSQEQLFDTFGNCGIEVREQTIVKNGTDYTYKVFRITHFSVGK